MSLWSTIFPGRSLISRVVYPYQASAYVITAPVGATLIRASLAGGGAHRAGGAFARVKAAATPGETFNLQIGDCAISVGAAAGNTVLTRNTGSVIICRADGAEANVAGTVAGSIGDTKRAGSLGDVSGNPKIGGNSAGDDADAYPLGYGGSGAYMVLTNAVDMGNSWLAAYHGAGGLFDIDLASVSIDGARSIYPGQGRATVEFFRADPGYS